LLLTVGEFYSGLKSNMRRSLDEKENVVNTAGITANCERGCLRGSRPSSSTSSSTSQLQPSPLT
jgi:hypothetical protein